MSEAKSTLKIELLKTLITGIIGATLTFLVQEWIDSDLEYKDAKRNSYISSPIGDQGLSLFHNGKEIKNISIVEFGIFNKTSRQFNDVSLIFTYNPYETSAKLVSSTIIPPDGIPKKDIIEELPTKEENSKGFLIKSIPKQQNDEYYHAVFIFEGDTAPSMTVTSTTSAATIVRYREWKDGVIASAIAIGILLLTAAAVFLTGTFIDFLYAEKHHKKTVDRFNTHALNLQNSGEIPLTTTNTIQSATDIFRSFTSPKPSIFWSKIFGRSIDHPHTLRGNASLAAPRPPEVLRTTEAP